MINKRNKVVDVFCSIYLSDLGVAHRFRSDLSNRQYFSPTRQFYYPSDQVIELN